MVVLHLAWTGLFQYFAGLDSINTIAFPKNTAGRDVMIDAPSTVTLEQLDELGIMLKPEELK